MKSNVPTATALSAALLATVLLAPGTAGAQEQEPLPHRVEARELDSGEVANQTPRQTTIWVDEVHVEDAVWLRLFFSRADLGVDPTTGAATTLRVTSIEDGAVQDHTPATLGQWQGSTAFFNGDRVRVELIADAGAPPSRLTLDRVMIGESGDGTDSICGAVDDRTLSTSDRNARIAPINCTVWMIDDAQKCFLSAGHCALSSSFQVVEFNVPLSESNGNVNHPPPEDQYPIDPASRQAVSGGIGNDWGYFGAFPNTQTGLTPFEAQGTAYTLGDPPSTIAGQTIRITGYGSVSGNLGTPREWNFVQKTHTGPLDSISGNTLRYAVDTTGGNSGSPVFHEDAGVAIGIHTHAGCNSGGGANHGTSILNAGLQNALANPTGICVPNPAFFEDGFESGDTTLWTETVPPADQG